MPKRAPKALHFRNAGGRLAGKPRRCGFELHRRRTMKQAIFSVVFSALALSALAQAADKDASKQEAAVQKDIDSIVSTCEKKKLPAEKEIECIEQGFLEFMDEMARQRAASR